MSFSLTSWCSTSEIKFIHGGCHCLVCTLYKSVNTILEKKEQNAAILWTHSRDPWLKGSKNMLHIKNNGGCFLNPNVMWIQHYSSWLECKLNRNDHFPSLPPTLHRLDPFKLQKVFLFKSMCSGYGFKLPWTGYVSLCVAVLFLV